MEEKQTDSLVKKKFLGAAVSKEDDDDRLLEYERAHLFKKRFLFAILWVIFHHFLIGYVWFCDISTIVGSLIPDPL